MARGTKNAPKKIRYGVVGLGWIAQTAVLPAFENAKQNSELVALFSGSKEKRSKVSKQYNVPAFSYEEFDRASHGVEMDAVYICSPNFEHCRDTETAARQGLHVLCEKPMAVTRGECKQMIDVCEKNDVKLMIAYRLHFEKANLSAARLVQSGKIGEARIFNSIFSMTAEKGNIRLEPGGGPLLDLGIYCINAARYLFRSEPETVTALFGVGDDPRFVDVEEMVSAVMRFPGDRLATFTCSFGATDRSYFEVVGTKGRVCLDPAYEYEDKLKQYLTVKNKTSEKIFPKSDQFGPELTYFSDCIIRNVEPEPGPLEGFNDLAIIDAIRRSAREERTLSLSLRSKNYPQLDQAQQMPPVKKTKVVKAQQPHHEAA